MKKLYEEAILNIKELIKLKEQQILLLNKLDKHSDTIPLTFKIKNYNIWVMSLNKCIKKNVNIENKDDIIKLQLTKSLENKLIELFENGNIKAINNTKTVLLHLEADTEKINKASGDKHSVNMFDSIHSTDDSIDRVVSKDSMEGIVKNNINSINNDIGRKIGIDFDDKVDDTIIRKSDYQQKGVENIHIIEKKIDKQDKQDKHLTSVTKKTRVTPKADKILIDKSLLINTDTVMSIDTFVDTSKIESQPKILASEVRPSDPRGGAIYDIRYLYGVGPKNAEKLVDNGITLDKILAEWSDWIKKNPLNAILMISQMVIPAGYTKKYWDTLSEDKHRTIQLSIFQDKLKKETTTLQSLNVHQLLGVKYFHDMSQKIPREEVKQAEKILIATANHMNKDINLTLCGSYRRGKDKSGDIDCLITHKDIKTQDDLKYNNINILASIVELLTNIGFLVDHLTDFGCTKYMGFCIIKQQGKKNPITRRIDIRFIPYDSYGTALLYFTGSKKFNTQMRAHALQKGYSLNEYNLKKISDNELFYFNTEEDVFTFLKYPYKTPSARDI